MQNDTITIKVPKDKQIIFEFEDLGTFFCLSDDLFKAWLEHTSNFIKL